MMAYIKWDSVQERVIGCPSNRPGPEPEWVACQMPGRRKSRAQTIQWTMTEDLDGNDLLVGSWSGSDDPDDTPVDVSEIRATWKEIMQYPVEANDGKVFQFDRDSRELIEGAIRALTAVGGTVDWRLDDNTTVTVNAAQLQAYYDELLVNQAVRGVTVDAEYVAYKASGATIGDLKAWRQSHMPDE